MKCILKRVYRDFFSALTPSVAIFFPIYLELSKKILTFADNLKRSVNKTTINLYKI